jgi:hypothetical protein
MYADAFFGSGGPRLSRALAGSGGGRELVIRCTTSTATTKTISNKHVSPTAANTVIETEPAVEMHIGSWWLESLRYDLGGHGWQRLAVVFLPAK